MQRGEEERNRLTDKLTGYGATLGNLQADRFSRSRGKLSEKGHLNELLSRRPDFPSSWNRATSFFGIIFQKVNFFSKKARFLEPPGVSKILHYILPPGVSTFLHYILKLLDYSLYFFIFIFHSMLFILCRSPILSKRLYNLRRICCGIMLIKRLGVPIFVA